MRPKPLLIAFLDSLHDHIRTHVPSDPIASILERRGVALIPVRVDDDRVAS